MDWYASCLTAGREKKHMKATTVILIIFAGLAAASCGEDSPKGVSYPIGAPILLPQSQGEQYAEGSENDTLTATEDIEPAGVDVAGVAEEITEEETGEETGYYNSACCEAEEKEAASQAETEAAGDEPNATEPELFDFSFFAATTLGGKLKPLNLVTDEPASQPDPAMVMTEGGTPWLVAFELTGRLMRYGIVKAGGNNSFKVEQDTELSFDFKDDAHECLKLFKVEIDMAGADHLGKAYPEGLLHISAARCVVSDTDTNTTISPDKIKIDMDSYKFWDPCLGEVVVNGRITCEGIYSNNKKTAVSKFAGTQWCVTNSVTYETAGGEYKITMPAGGQYFMATWNGNDLGDASIFKLNGDIKINGKYGKFNFSTPAPAKVLSCLNLELGT